MKSFFLTLLLCLLYIPSCLSQAFLVLETKGKIKSLKYPIGSIIRIHLKEDPAYLWQNHTILDLDLTHACIRVSDLYCIELKDIDGFDSTPSKGNAIQKLTGKFFLQWAFFSVAQAIFRPPLTAFHFTVAGVTALVWGYSKIFLNGQKKLKGKHRLRLIDLTMVRPKA